MIAMVAALFLLFAMEQDAGERLAGSSWREWTLHRFEMTMGASAGCRSGESYRFSADHTLTIRQCKEGRVVTTTEKWSVSKEGEVDTILTVGDKRYHLFFKREAGTDSMRLEIRPDLKAPIQDFDFRLNKSGTGQ